MTDAAERSRLLGDVFAKRDPPAVVVGLTVAEFEAFVRLYGPKAHAEGLTVVARSATGDLVSALLAEDSGSKPPAGVEQLSSKCNPMFDILGQLDAECVANSRRKGYPLAVTEATNKTSQHLFRNLGFVERVRRSYNDHQFEGRAFVTSVADQESPMLMEKSLNL